MSEGFELGDESSLMGGRCASFVESVPRGGSDSTGNGTAAGGPKGGPITGEQVVPPTWRNSLQSGPMHLAGDNASAFHEKRSLQ